MKNSKFASPAIRNAITSLVCLTVLIVGCKNKDAGSGASLKSREQLSSDTLLLKLPTTTAAFMVMDFSGEGYKLFGQSPYGGSKNAKQSIDSMIERAREAGATEDLIKVMQRVLDSSVELGIVAADGTYTVEKVFSRSVLFGGPATNSALPVEAGLFLKAAPGVSMTDKLEIVRRSLSSSALKMGEEAVAGATKSFTVELTNISGKAYFAANSETLGVALNKVCLEGLFASANTGAIEAIQASPEYKQATTPFKTPEKPLAFTFVSLTRLRPLLDAAAKADESGEFKPAEIPFDAVAIQSSFPKQYVHNIGMAVTPKTETQTKVFSALQESALSPAVARVPTDAALSVSLDTRFLGKLEQMIKSIEESAPADVTDHIKKLQSVTVGLRNNSAGSPLPDLFLVLESSGREQLSGFLESSLGMAMSLSGQNASWQTKDIEGTNVKFFTTLIGAGVYMSSPSNSKALVIGSSETVLKDLLAAQSGKSTSATASMPDPLKNQITTANVASFYLNFKKVADVLDSVKNTLAMFTGGNSELNDLLESADIRSWGLSAGGISYTPGVLAINSSLETSAQ
jgi:hypothetical protein